MLYLPKNTWFFYNMSNERSSEDIFLPVAFVQIKNCAHTYITSDTFFNIYVSLVLKLYILLNGIVCDTVLVMGFPPKNWAHWPGGFGPFASNFCPSPHIYDRINLKHKSGQT